MVSVTNCCAAIQRSHSSSMCVRGTAVLSSSRATSRRSAASSRRSSVGMGLPSAREVPRQLTHQLTLNGGTHLGLTVGVSAGRLVLAMCVQPRPGMVIMSTAPSWTRAAH